MKITRIEIENIRGVEKLMFVPDTLTVISGANGTGKSSIIAALQGLVAGGHDPTLLRKGAESGRVLAVFDDGVSLSLTVKPTKSERAVRDAKGRKISAPQSVIDELADAISFDPLSFLEADEAKQTKWLLEALPISVTAETLKKAGIPTRGADLSGHGLVVLGRLHKLFYDERRAVTRDAKSKQATISQLQDGLPEADAGISSALETAEQELQTLETDRAKMIAAINDQFNGQIQERRELLGTLKTKAAEAQRVEGQRQAIAKMQREVSELEVEIEGLNASLTSIASLRDKLTSDLPIKGLEITDGKFFIDGIPLSTLNTADRIMDVALQVGLLRMKQLPFLVIDNGERLDSNHLETLKRVAVEKGLQVVISRVTDEPKLTVSA